MTELTPWTNKEKSLNQIDYLNANNFRDLRTNIEYKLQHKKEKIFVITSSNQGEGKSYCALNTALAFAEAKKTVLLVDMDLHRPRLSKQLGFINKGVTTIYEDDLNYQDCLISVAERVSFLGSGNIPLNSAEILTSDAVRKAIYEAAKLFDIIIIDSPPARLSPDTKLIISEFKNVLFVVRANKTRDKEINEAFAKLKLINPTILGTVLNMKRISHKDRIKYEYN